MLELSKLVRVHDMLLFATGFSKEKSKQLPEKWHVAAPHHGGNRDFGNDTSRRRENAAQCGATNTVSHYSCNGSHSHRVQNHKPHIA